MTNAHVRAETVSARFGVVRNSPASARAATRRSVVAGALPALALLFGVPPAHAGCIAPPPGMVGWWPLDGNGNDLIGGNTGTLVGPASFTPGMVDQALSVNGGYLEVPDSLALEFGGSLPMSYDMWLLNTTNNFVEHFIGKRNSCAGGQEGTYQGGRNFAEFAFLGTTAGPQVNTDVPLPFNTWTHVAFTFDGTTLKGYIDGQPHGTTLGPMGPANNAPLRIGTSGFCAGFGGLIDEVEIFSRALTNEEVQAIYEAGPAGKCKRDPVDATWKTSPQSGDWNTAANWSGNVVPDQAGDTARFGVSNVTNVTVSAPVEVGSIVFKPGASAYVFDLRSSDPDFIVSGTGVTNNSGIVQNWDLNNDGIFEFQNSATAGKLTVYTAEGGSVAEGGPGHIVFHDTSTASNATLIANGGVLPGTIEFLDASLGGKARVDVLGGTLDIGAHNVPGVSVGSIEGTGGLALLGGNKLTVGGNNLSTSFTGEILDGILTSDAARSPLAGGSLAKVGTGTLVLANNNTYSGGTTVSAGALLLQHVDNSGSQTGSGNVIVNAGTLGGDGIATGNVNIGNSSGPRAILAPGFSSEITDILTAKKKLTFKSDADFVCQFDSGQVLADKVQGRGVTIQPGATFSFSEVGTGAMQIGTVFILINNTSATPISGTFAGLPEGAEFVAGNYRWRVTYVGGSGNDFSGEIIEGL